MNQKNLFLLAPLLLAVTFSGCATKKKAPATTAQPAQKAQPAAKPVDADVYYDIPGKRWRTWDGRPCSRCTAQNGYAVPRVMDEDMYYDPAVRKWRQSSMKGAVCHTCTPRYGYPIPPK